MTDLLNIIAEVAVETANTAEQISGAGSTILELVVMLPGVLLLSYWIGRGSVGEIANSRVRRNWVPYLVPFGMMFVWLLLSNVIQNIIGAFVLQDSCESQILQYLGRGLVNFVMIIVMLFVARSFFSGGIKGFGLDIRNCLEQFKWSVVNYVAVIPLVMLGLAIVELMGVTIEQHESLVTASRSDSVALKVIIVIFVITIVPVFEEMIFRGMLQSMIVGYVRSKWWAIIVTSIMFTVMHMSKTHWLALFALSVCLGYAYEKSGSLWRSIFIHAIFNGVSVTLMLLGQ